MNLKLVEIRREREREREHESNGDELLVARHELRDAMTPRSMEAWRCAAVSAWNSKG